MIIFHPSESKFQDFSQFSNRSRIQLKSRSIPVSSHNLISVQVRWSLIAGARLSRDTGSGRLPFPVPELTNPPLPSDVSPPFIRMKTSFGVLPRDCRMIVVVEPRGRPADVSRRPNQTTPEAVRDNQPSNNLPPSERSVAWRTETQPFTAFSWSQPQVSEHMPSRLGLIIFHLARGGCNAAALYRSLNKLSGK